MQIDELKSELTTLADEIPPFDGDLTTLHRHDRRRRVITSSLVAALVVVVAVATVAVIRQGRDSRVHVSGAGSKEVQSRDISHIDAIVVPASPDAQGLLDSSALVGQYALIPHSDRSAASPPPSRVKSALCALQSNDGYAVDAATPGTDIAGALQRVLGTQATVYDVSDDWSADFEVFLNVDASTQQVALVQAALVRDPDIFLVRHLSKSDAYATFAKDFADQPDLVQSTKPADLPESFRVILQPNRPVPAVVRRYQHLDGVDIVISATSARLFDPGSMPRPTGKLISPCATP
jgi:hypothetical protein